MSFEEFLSKETPGYGGCMLCLAKYKMETYDIERREDVEKILERYMLVERRKIANGDMFTINGRFACDYKFAWDEEMPWKVLYKNNK